MMVNRTKQTGKKQERKRENERTTDWSSDPQNQKEGCMDGRYVLMCVRVYLFVCVCVCPMTGEKYVLKGAYPQGF